MDQQRKQEMPRVDQWICEFDQMLRTVMGVTRAQRPNPAAQCAPVTLSPAEQRHAAGLMRVNHVGEVCAQALYQAQKLSARSPVVRQQFAQASAEEQDHLAWCAARLDALGARPSVLNPLWYAGAFVVGAVAAQAGDAVSLGFVAETERQVEHHLQNHLERLPTSDQASRAIVHQMIEDERHHGLAAQQAGGIPLPRPLRSVMRRMAQLMTRTAYYL